MKAKLYTLIAISCFSLMSGCLGHIQEVAVDDETQAVCVFDATGATTTGLIIFGAYELVEDSSLKTTLGSSPSLVAALAWDWFRCWKGYKSIHIPKRSKTEKSGVEVINRETFFPTDPSLPTAKPTSYKPLYGCKHDNDCDKDRRCVKKLKMCVYR